MLRLIINIEQARIIFMACNFYGKIFRGYFDEILWHTYDKHHCFESGETEYTKNREEAKKFLLKARDVIYPEIKETGVPFGPGKFKHADEALIISEFFEGLLKAEFDTLYKHETLDIILEKIISDNEFAVLMSKETAIDIAVNCEFFARIKIGQFKEILWHISSNECAIGDYCQMRDKTEELLLEARKIIYPELHGFGHSFGGSKFEDSARALDIHDVIRCACGEYRPPFRYYDIPKCEVVNIGKDSTTNQ